MTHAETDALPVTPTTSAEPWLDMTERAAKAFKRLASKRNRPDAVLRVRVAPDHTCGDYKYAMGIEPGARAGDVMVEFHGMSVIVDSGSVEMLRGATIDYSEALIDGGFQIENPNARSSCGCGLSFTTSGRQVESRHAGRGVL